MISEGWEQLWQPSGCCHAGYPLAPAFTARHCQAVRFHCHTISYQVSQAVAPLREQDNAKPPSHGQMEISGCLAKLGVFLIDIWHMKHKKTSGFWSFYTFAHSSTNRSLPFIRASFKRRSGQKHENQSGPLEELHVQPSTRSWYSPRHGGMTRVAPCRTRMLRRRCQSWPASIGICSIFRYKSTHLLFTNQAITKV